MRSLKALLALLLGAVLLLPIASPASAAPYCGIRWGSLAEHVATMSTGTVDGVRSGRHLCYDRLVVDVEGDVEGYTVRYVSAVTGSSGAAVPLRGGARLQVVANVPAYVGGTPTYFPANRREVVDVTGYQTFRQVAWVESFEGYTVLGLGVRARLPFRVFTLDGPGGTSRMVVDVAHSW